MKMISTSSLHSEGRRVPHRPRSLHEADCHVVRELCGGNRADVQRQVSHSFPSIRPSQTQTGDAKVSPLFSPCEQACPKPMKYRTAGSTVYMQLDRLLRGGRFLEVGSCERLVRPLTQKKGVMMSEKATSKCQGQSLSSPILFSGAWRTSTVPHGM